MEGALIGLYRVASLLPSIETAVKDFDFREAEGDGFLHDLAGGVVRGTGAVDDCGLVLWKQFRIFENLLRRNSSRTRDDLGVGEQIQRLPGAGVGGPARLPKTKTFKESVTTALSSKEKPAPKSGPSSTAATMASAQTRSPRSPVANPVSRRTRSD